MLWWQSVVTYPDGTERPEEMLEKNGVLKNLSETNQITFGFGDESAYSPAEKSVEAEPKPEAPKKAAQIQEEPQETASQLTFF